jgi:predicted nucleic acid-binding protein
VQILALEPADYTQALERMARLGLAGGGIYDALLAELAVRNQVTTLFTFNLKHFIRLGSDIQKMTREP